MTSPEFVRHILLIRFRPETQADQIQAFFDRFRGLSQSIDGILGFEYGANNSPEGKNHGYTHAVMLTFASNEARDTYLPHPEHRKFGQWLGEVKVLEDLIVLDYVAAG